jgi:hypothetical protein
MSEAYLVAGSELLAGTSLDELLKSICTPVGIRPRQIDEIHLFTDAASALFKRTEDTIAGPCFTWPLLPLIPAIGLQSLCRAMEVGELSLCLLAEISASGSSAILLANPISVGRFNLNPMVHLANRLSHADGLENLLTTTLKTLAAAPAEIEPEEPVVDLRVPKAPAAQPWVAFHTSEITADLDWPENRMLFNANMCGSLLDLAAAMKITKTDRGVWMSVTPDGPILSTLVLPL